MGFYKWLSGLTRNLFKKPPATKRKPPATKRKPPATKRPPPATKRPPPATKRPPPATKRPPPATNQGRFVEGYFDQYHNDPNGLHEAFSDIAETYIPSGQWTDEKQEQLEWAVVLIEAGEYDAFFSYLDLSYDDIQDFWDDFREAYIGSE